MSLLDGKFVPDSEINSKKHKFMGAFRSPSPPRSDGTWGVYSCPCGHSLWTVEAVFDHWKNGHMDEMQYITMED